MCGRCGVYTRECARSDCGSVAERGCLFRHIFPSHDILPSEQRVGGRGRGVVSDGLLMGTEQWCVGFRAQSGVNRDIKSLEENSSADLKSILNLKSR